MTANRSIRKRKKLSGIGFGEGCYAFLLLFFLCLFCKNGRYASDALREGLLICARSVIPSLFPFMVLSGMILASPILTSLLARIAYPLQKWLNLSPTGAAVVCIGMGCGFPAGAVFAANAVRDGRMTTAEAPRVLAAGSNPSPAFFIGILGKELLGDVRKGLLLYGIVLLSQLTVGGLFARISKNTVDPSPDPGAPGGTVRPIGARFTTAVKDSAFGMLTVCAFVLFFSACAGALRAFLAAVGCPNSLQAALFCLTELTGGCFAAAKLPSPAISSALIAFAAGWSGLSVHFQLLTLTEGTTDSYHLYWQAKLSQGILCAMIGFWGLR